MSSTTDKNVYIESDPESSSCPGVGISFAKELQGLFCKEHLSLRPPCLSQELLLLSLLLLAVKSEKGSQRSNGIRLPLSPSGAEKEKGLSSPLKPLQAELDHKETHITHKMHVHKKRRLPNSWN